MANPFAPLIRMVEQRIARQSLSLEESKLQLAAAISAHAEHEAGEATKQIDMVALAVAKAAAAKPVK